MDKMTPMRYLTHIDRLIYEYYMTELAIPNGEQEKPGYRNLPLAELGDRIVRLLEEEAHHYRHFAARWRGER